MCTPPRQLRLRFKNVRWARVRCIDGSRGASYGQVMPSAGPLLRSLRWMRPRSRAKSIGMLCVLACGLGSCGDSQDDPPAPTGAEIGTSGTPAGAQGDPSWEQDLYEPLQKALAQKRQGSLQDLLLPTSHHRFPIAGAGRSVHVAGMDLRLIEAEDASALDRENLLRQWFAFFAGWSGEIPAHWRILDPVRVSGEGQQRVRLLARFAGRHANGSLQSLRLEMDLFMARSEAGPWRIQAIHVLRGMQGTAAQARYRSIGPWVGLQSAQSPTNRAGLAQTDQEGALRWAGLTVTDWNQDGFPDLLWTRHGQHSELFRNDGSSGFVPDNVPLEVPQESPGFLLSVDLNQDGVPELVGTRFLRFEKDWGYLGLYARSPGGLWRLEENAIALPVGAGQRHAVVHSITPIDVDRDGRLDLAFAMGGEGQRWNLDSQRPEFDAAPRPQRNYLLRNLGGLRFQEDSEASGWTGEASTAQFTPLDWNADGYWDLYEANRAPWQDHLWLGGPGGHFAEPIAWFDAARSPHIPMGDHWGARAWTRPGERRQALLVWGRENDPLEPGNLWLQPSATGPAQRLASSAGLRYAGRPRGAVPLDVGNRGASDLLLFGEGSQGPAVSLWLQAGRGPDTFEEVAHLLGLGDLPSVRAAVACDVDGDGDQDLVFASETGELSLFADVGLSGSAARIELVPQAGSPWGATVDVTVQGRTQRRTQRRTVAPATGPSSQMETALHFGLGEASQIDRIQVLWPDGTSESWEDIRVPAHVRLVQGKTRARSAPPLRWSQAAPFQRPLPQIGGYARLLDGRNHPLGESDAVNIVHLVAQASPHRPLPWPVPSWPHAEEFEISLMVMDADGWVPPDVAEFRAYALDSSTLEAFVGEALDPKLPATFVFAPGGALVRAFPLPPSEADLRAVVELARAERGYPEVLVRNGFEALQDRRYEDALRCFGDAIESDASRLDAYLGLAHTQRYLGQVDAALLAMFNATRVDPDFGLAHRLLGSLQLSTGQGKEAMASFQRVLQLDGDSVQAWFALYEAAAQAEEWQVGLEAIDKTLATLQPSDSSALYADAHCARGKLLERLRQPAQALAAYRKALARDPAHPEALHRERTLAPHVPKAKR